MNRIRLNGGCFLCVTRKFKNHEQSVPQCILPFQETGCNIKYLDRTFLVRTPTTRRSAMLSAASMQQTMSAVPNHQQRSLGGWKVGKHVNLGGWPDKTRNETMSKVDF
jgi:hypothetical protein